MRPVIVVILLGLLASRASSEICKVYAPDTVGQSQGHGVYVGDGIVLTAYHVIRGAKDAPYAVFSGNRKYTSTRLARSQGGYDLAALFIGPQDDLKASKLCQDWPSNVSTARNSGPTTKRSENRLTWQAISWPGDSGGPVWCDKGVVSVISASNYVTFQSSGESPFSIGPPPQAVFHFARNVQQGWCPDGTCFPRTYPQYYQPSPQTQTVPSPDNIPSVPIPRAADVPTDEERLPTKPDNRESDEDSRPVDTDEIVDALIEQIAKDERFKGRQGPRGPAGPQGPPGPATDAGVISDFSRRITELRSDLSRINEDTGRMLKQMTFDVEVVHPNGRVQTGQVHAHGGMLRLDFSQETRYADPSF